MYNNANRLRNIELPENLFSNSQNYSASAKEKAKEGSNFFKPSSAFHILISTVHYTIPAFAKC